MTDERRAPKAKRFLKEADYDSESPKGLGLPFGIRCLCSTNEHGPVRTSVQG